MGMKGERFELPGPRVGPNQRLQSSTPAWDGITGYAPQELRALLAPEPWELEALPIDDPPALSRVSPEAQRAAVDWARGCPPGETEFKLRGKPEDCYYLDKFGDVSTSFVRGGRW